MCHGKNTSYTLREKNLPSGKKKATVKSLIYNSLNNAVNFYYERKVPLYMPTYTALAKLN